jgi:nitrate/nitrite transporter NarK
VVTIRKIDWQRYGLLIALIIAGEMIFSLPFHIPRFFRPTLLEVFQLSNTQLGDIFAVYGVIALLAYFPGGALADRFSCRSLMTLSLVATALGGLYLYTLPGHTGLYLLFAYWGLTSILLFWAALIKATRDWGGEHTQGIAFGVLEGGRGLMASVFATLALLLLSQSLSSGATPTAALQQVILFYSAVTLLAAILIWWLLPANVTNNTPMQASRPQWRQLFAGPSAWLQATVVICAYCGYKALDNYGIYAVEVLGMSQLEATSLITYASYTRPIAAIGAGLLADRWKPSGLIALLFACATAAFFTLSQSHSVTVLSTVVMANLLVTFIAVYALRGIYFSLIEEAGIDRRVTGAAVGLISMLGFTPDIFFSAVTGRILDANPGAVGFQNYFLLMAGITALGMLCTLALSWRFSVNRRNNRLRP